MFLSNIKYGGNKDTAVAGLSLASSLLPITIGSYAGGAIC